MMIRSIIFVLLSAFLLSACSQNIGVDRDNFVLSATGYGTTISQAKTNAMASLSSIILVSLQNSSFSSETLNNQTYDTFYNSNTNIATNSYFQGLKFSKQQKKNGQIAIDVGITKQSYNGSVEYLANFIQPSIIKTADKSTLFESREKVSFLVALINYSPALNIVVDSQIKINATAYLKQLNEVLSAQAQLQVIVYPNVDNVKISLNDESVDFSKPIYLKVGSYLYKADKVGFLSKQGEFNISQGEQKQLKIYFQRRQKNKLPIKIIIENSSNIDNKFWYGFAKTTIAENQMVINKLAKESLILTINPVEVISVGNFYSLNIGVNLEILGKIHYSNISYISKDAKAIIPSNFIKDKLSDNFEYFLADLY